jgi:hypothetical protein
MFVGHGLRVYGKSSLAVIQSEAKNPSWIITKGEEGFFAKNQRSE